MASFSDIFSRYTKMIGDRSHYSPLWDDIARYVGIQVNTDYVYNGGEDTRQDQLDEYVDDPTSAISVNQFGDYLIGVLWGNGEDVFKLRPSRYVTGLIDEQSVQDWYAYATDQSLFHMNHPAAGLRSKLHEYAYDQAAFGNSAVGAFANKKFLEGAANNALIFKSYGIDNGLIDEGIAGLPEYFFCTYHWRTSRIVGEFCSMEDGPVDELIDLLPKQIADAWKQGDINKTFKIVFGFFPRDDYDPRLKGKRGTPYKGVWFMADGSENRFFHEEDFMEKPVAWARMIKIRGEVYGRSSGTMLLSSIRSVNQMLGTGIEVIEKMANPSLGMLSNALFGDGVLDTSPDGVNVFNAQYTQGQAPVFPVYDVGDPSALVNFMIPYLNDKITTAFKVDALLDFNSQANMTATESLQRFAIRSKSVSGILSQQKVELLDVIIPRSIGVLWRAGELGIDATQDEEAAARLQEIGAGERIIPDAVLQVVNEGKPWYDISYNNEMDRMVRSESVQNLLQVVQSTLAIAQADPRIIEAVDWYAVLKDINDNLNTENQIMLTEREFKQRIEQLAQQQAAQAQLQATQQVAAADKDAAQAEQARANANA